MEATMLSDAIQITIAYDGVEMDARKLQREEGYLQVDVGDVIIVLSMEHGHSGNMYPEYAYAERVSDKQRGWLPSHIFKAVVPLVRPAMPQVPFRNELEAKSCQEESLQSMMVQMHVDSLKDQSGKPPPPDYPPPQTTSIQPPPPDYPPPPIMSPSELTLRASTSGSSHVVTSHTTSMQNVALSLQRMPYLNAWWANYFAHERELAKANEMTRQSINTWFCKYCDRDIADGNLQEHLQSNKHKKYKWIVEEQMLLKIKHMRNELPPYMELGVNGFLYCKLCGVTSNESHEASQRHKRKVAWYNSEKVQPQTCFPCLSTTTSVLTPTHHDFAASSTDFPKSWGDKRHFEWEAENQSWWCRLCWKYADDDHIRSRKHRGKIQWTFDAFRSNQPPPLPAVKIREEDFDSWMQWYMQ